MSSSINVAPANRRAVLLWAAVLIALLKLIEFAIDSQVLLDTDSGAFVVNALHPGWVTFRSYVYGMLIRFVALPFHSLRPMVAVQCLLGGITAWLLCYCLLKFFGVRSWIAIVCALALAIDPVQVVHEHLILSETPALFAMAVYLVTALIYLRNRNALLLVALSLLGALLVSLRFVYVPVVYAAAAMVPLIAWLPIRSKNARYPALALALLVSVTSTFLFQSGYKYITGRLVGREPAYQFWTGFFLLGSASPIVQTRDIDDPLVRRVFDEQRNTKSPPTLGFQVAQIWASDGLRERLTSAFHGDERAAERAARRVARAAIRRDPVGFARLGLITYVRYWRDIPHLGEPSGPDLFKKLLPQDAPLLSSLFGNNVVSQADHGSLTRRYYFFTRYYFVFLLLSPYLLLLALCVRPAQPKFVLFLFLWSCLLSAATFLSVGGSVYRYLHPFSFLALAAVGLLCERLATRAGAWRSLSDGTELNTGTLPAR